MGKYIMALDEGTSSARCIIFDKAGNNISEAHGRFEQIYPNPGWVEHDAEEILAVQIQAAKDALSKAGLTAKDIDAIGITNQRETAVIWDKHTGKPVYNAIVWQCRRTAEYCDSLKTQLFEEKFREKTGLLIDPYFSGTKIRWILENVPGAREKAEGGGLLFGTIETWLIWNLTGGKVHVTDYSNASRTMIFNIKTLDWDEEILKILNIPKSLLPKPVPSSCVYGETSCFGEPIKIAGAAGDQQCSLFGQACFAPGDAKTTYGTGAFLLMNTGNTPVYSKNGLVTTIAWGINGRVDYALEGSVFACGAAIQWIRDGLEFFDRSAESERLALQVEDTGGVYFVPALVGLGAPYWDPYARGMLTGITRGTRKEHISRAALESVAYQAYDVLKAMEQDSGEKIGVLKVDGGVTSNNFLMQFQSDIMESEIKRPKCLETTALGAAYLAGLATGYWGSLDDIKNNWAVDKIYKPQMAKEMVEEKLNGWKHAIDQTLV